jgi:hypothetical protein
MAEELRAYGETIDNVKMEELNEEQRDEEQRDEEESYQHHGASTIRYQLFTVHTMAATEYHSPIIRCDAI